MYGNMTFDVYIGYDYAHKLCTKYSLNVRNYKIFLINEDLRLCTADKFNKNNQNQLRPTFLHGSIITRPYIRNIIHICEKNKEKCESLKIKCFDNLRRLQEAEIRMYLIVTLYVLFILLTF